MKNFSWKLFSVGIFISFISIFFDKYEKIPLSKTISEYSLGFPLKWVIFYGKNMPNRKTDLFFTHYFFSTSFRIDLLILNSITVFILFKIVIVIKNHLFI